MAATTSGDFEALLAGRGAGAVAAGPQYLALRDQIARAIETGRLPPGTPLHHIMRRRSVDGRAVLIERIVVDPALAPDLLAQPLDGSLTQILSGRYGLSVVRNRIDMRPCALVEATAAALGVKPGTPGLLIVRTSLDPAGRVVEYDQEYWRHDAIRIHVDLGVRAATPSPPAP